MRELEPWLSGVKAADLQFGELSNSCPGGFPGPRQRLSGPLSAQAHWPRVRPCPALQLTGCEGAPKISGLTAPESHPWGQHVEVQPLSSCVTSAEFHNLSGPQPLPLTDVSQRTSDKRSHLSSAGEVLEETGPSWPQCEYSVGGQRLLAIQVDFWVPENRCTSPCIS